jgi:Cu2+-exporting ATPase
LHDALVTAIAVLIITCPCALALAVPAVQVVASGALFRRGVLIHAGDALERLAAIDTIIFDKTGTLTHPEPQLVEPARYPSHVLTKAARLAALSHHPLAAALARCGDGAHAPALEAVEEPGQGVRAMIDGVEARLGRVGFCGVALTPPDNADPASSFIAFAHGADQALFEIRQTLRLDAAATCAGLRALGLDIMILSGDRPEAVARIARELGVSNSHGGVKPADKIAWVEAMQAQGRRVLMVGDGINDAPALAAAHVSISPVSATDLAQAQADLVFMGERLRPVLLTLRIARLAHAIMRQNLVLAIGYNVMAVPLAMAGLVTPLIAAAAMSGSSILVTLNALRAGRLREEAAP